jgi:LacI family transcriptional regulator
MEKRIGIKEVAKEAGVSIATVSYVINNKSSESLSSETVEKVLAAVKKLNYVPNLSARILASNKSNLIGVVIPQTEPNKEFMFSNPFYAEFLSSFEYAARVMGYHVLISGTNADENYIEIAKKRNLDGIVILGIYSHDIQEKLKQSDIPIVMVDSYVQSHHFSTIGTDDRYGGYIATKHLIEKGHKKIAIVTGIVTEDGVNCERLSGYKDALKEAGIRYEERYIFEGNVDYEYGVESAEKIRLLKDEITAIFCTADILAMGLIKGLRKYNINVPTDMSVMGFDDVFIAKVTDPSLTTVNQNVSAKGERAAKMIIGLATQNLKGKQNYIIPLEVVTRESVKEV